MKVMVFTEGTIIMHKNAIGHTREEIIEQVKNKEHSVHEYGSYVPIGNAVEKIRKWKRNGAEVFYLTSRRNPQQIEEIRKVLIKYHFPKGKLVFCDESEEYKDVVERVFPDALIEDDCESIGGRKEMTITHVRPEIRDKIKSITIQEFNGIDDVEL
ncbi:hypothetical protein FJZ18_02670 [Candidatus Pacearchaeota archaeon]|nr:hypothetical protein [Candidatus Pacearchaeota archaeon]